MAKYRGVRPAGSGIEIRYQIGGKRYSKYLAMAPTERGLQDAARLRKSIIEHANLSEGEPIALTFEDACAEYLKDLAKERKASTVDTYRKRLVTHWSGLAHLDIRQLTLTTIKAADRERNWKTQKTRRDALSALSCVLRWAGNEQYITDNPVRQITVGKHQRPETDPFTEDEIAKIMQHVDGTPSLLFRLMLHTGIRTGEARALRWDCVDKDSITVKATIYKGEMADTKTSHSRKVMLTGQAKTVLKEAEPSRFLKGWVFPTSCGNPYSEKELVRRWKGACKASGVRYRRPYTLRHTYASRALSAGVEPAWLASQLGDLLTTVIKHYARWMGQERDARELAKLEAI